MKGRIGRNQFRAHRPWIEVETGNAARRGMKGRIDIVRAGLAGCDRDTAPCEAPAEAPASPSSCPSRRTGPQSTNHSCRLPAGWSPGTDRAAPRPASAPSQSSDCLSRTTSPTTTIAGGSRPEAATAAGASPSVVSEHLLIASRCVADEGHRFRPGPPRRNQVLC